MTSNETQERSTQEQKTESTLKRRAARQKRVQRIVQILGFPSSGFGIVTADFFCYDNRDRSKVYLRAV